jgi:hypothetical protein
VKPILFLRVVTAYGPVRGYQRMVLYVVTNVWSCTWLPAFGPVRGYQRMVLYVVTNVPEERIVSIFRVTTQMTMIDIFAVVRTSGLKI